MSDTGSNDTMPQENALPTDNPWPNDNPWPIEESMIVVPSGLTPFGNVVLTYKRTRVVPHGDQCKCPPTSASGAYRPLCSIVIGKLNFFLHAKLRKEFGDRVLRKIILIRDSGTIFAATCTLIERVETHMRNFVEETNSWCYGTNWILIPPRPVGGYQGPRLFLNPLPSFRQSYPTTLSLSPLCPSGIRWWMIDKLVEAIKDATGVVWGEWLNANTTIGCSGCDGPFIQLESVDAVALLRVAITNRLAQHQPPTVSPSRQYLQYH